MTNYINAGRMCYFVTEWSKAVVNCLNCRMSIFFISSLSVINSLIISVSLLCASLPINKISSLKCFAYAVLLYGFCYLSSKFSLCNDNNLSNAFSGSSSTNTASNSLDSIFYRLKDSSSLIYSMIFFYSSRSSRTFYLPTKP